MWQKWTTLLLVCCALVGAEETTAAVSVATTSRPPPRTLDRQAAELAWKAWLQSPESGNQNAPARRITTKSLFITPLNCPKGQRLDRNGCVQVLTINQDEHERILLEQLNAWFTPAPSGDVYDYGDEEPGPLQLSIPIGLDPLAAPLQGQDPTAQAQELQGNFIKVEKKPNGDANIEAELELLKLQNNNYTSHSVNAMNLNDLTNINLHPDKPKRDSSAVNVTDNESLNNTSQDVGQKEEIFGHVKIDPVIYHIDNESINTDNVAKETETVSLKQDQNYTKTLSTAVNTTEILSDGTKIINETAQVLKTNDGDKSKLSPENDYSDIGEAIKLISRYAEVTTDDNFAKDQKKNAATDDSILGTRTRLQHRRNKPKGSENMEASANKQQDNGDKPHNIYPKSGVYYRYPWAGQHVPTPPPDYPFRHLQDYWSGRNKFGGVYNTHENPRRHHHSFAHNLRPNGNPFVGLPNVRDMYPQQLKGYIHRVAQRHLNPTMPRSNNQDLYSLLGLRHWFSSEGTSKR